MACIAPNATPEQKAAKEKTRKIDELLAKDAKSYRNEVRILLLGAGESGKSTVFKQMKIIQKGGGYKKEELIPYREVIYVNCLTQMKILVSASMKLNLALEKPENEVHFQRILKTAPSPDSWSREVGESILALWDDKAILTAYGHRDKLFQLNDSAEYFFSNVSRYLDPNFTPSEQDVLRSRVRTTGIEEAVFKFENMSFRMIDVGGQRAERRKWIHCFDAITAVIFCASLSDYDQKLREDTTMNRMQESLALFEEIVNSPWFRDRSVILFLNKVDIFKEKVTKVNLNTCFTEYNGGLNYEAASSYVENQFLNQNEGHNPVYVHFTCAVNTENINIVFGAVRETLMKEVMGEIAL